MRISNYLIFDESEYPKAKEIGQRNNILEDWWKKK
jgi:hypothetical protein